MKIPLVQLKWIVQPNDTQVSVGNPLFIPCSAEGQPTPKVLWRKIDSSSDDRQPSSISEFPELNFQSVKPTDSGTYECRASNGHDDDLIARVQLIVRGK